MDHLDTRPGEVYLLPKIDAEACFELKGKKRDGTYVLRHERTGRQQTFKPAEFRAMRFDGRAIRIGKAALAAARAMFDQIEPVLFPRWRGDPAGETRRAMGFHRPSGSTNRVPASGKPFGPGQFGPNPSVSGSADAPHRPSPKPSTLARIPSGRTIQSGRTLL
ncbi:MAG: hypothetical protein AB7I79_23275 [Rhizobiaceae bacterium]